jgi:hypothetical protein
MRFLSYEDLGGRGIKGTKVTIWRRERRQQFPARKHNGKFPFWPEPVIDAFQRAIALGHSEAEATIIAEHAIERELDLEGAGHV